MIVKPPAPGVAKFTWTFLCSGRNYGDSFFLQHADTAPWTVAELASCAELSAEAWGAVLAPLTSISCSLQKVSGLDLSDTAGREGSYTDSIPGGITTATSPPLPLNTVMHISFEVGRRYRGARPSTNVSGRVQSNLMDERTWVAADAESVKNAVKTAITATAAGAVSTAVQVGVSYFLENALRAVPLVLPIIGNEVQERVCTLRKRLGKAIAELV